jgi:hypothetical protein
MTWHVLHRVQLKRSKGWRMRDNTAKVDRTTRWGNFPAEIADMNGAEAVGLFARWVENDASEQWKQAAIRALKGKNLACWCKTGAPLW